MFSLRRGQPTLLLILWAAAIEGGYASQRWLTYAQTQAAGGSVRRGQRGTTICYADRFTPKGEAERARDEDCEARQLAFLKRFTVFNVDQCEGLPERLAVMEQGEPVGEADRIPAAYALASPAADAPRFPCPPRAGSGDLRIGAVRRS